MDLKYYERDLNDSEIMARTTWCDAQNICHKVAVVDVSDTGNDFDICVQWTFFSQQDLMSFVITWQGAPTI